LEQKKIIEKVFKNNESIVFETLVNRVYTEISYNYLQNLLNQVNLDKELFLKTSAHAMMKVN
jgi:hypothetical protein